MIYSYNMHNINNNSNNFICMKLKKMNEKQLEFLNNKPYLLRAFEQITEEDKKYMDSLNAENISKEQVKELQKIAKKMTDKMTIKEKCCFWKDLITLMKLKENG